MPARPRLSTPCFALVIALLAACGGAAPPPVGDACETDDDCPSGEVCSGGACSAPRDAGEPLGAPEIDVSPDTLDFGSPQLGVQVTQELTVMNRGDGELTLSRVQVIEDDSLSEYTAAPSGLVTIGIAPGESLRISVTLTQQDAEVDRGELRLSTDDADEPIVPVTLVSELKGTPRLSARPAVVDFGVVTFGDLRTRDLDVTNAGTGNAPLGVSSIEVTDETGLGGAFSMEFLLVDVGTGEESPATLPVLLSAGGQALRARVTLDSRTLGAGAVPAESLRIRSDDADDPDLRLPIIGAVIGCALPEVERCNGRDDDCDGAIDDGDPGSGAPCAAPLPGACGAGTLHCISGAPSCVSTTGATPETCNAVDDDCDGDLDESLVRPCSTSCGSGIEFCALGGWHGCNAPSAAPDLCDRLDNDCDPTTPDGAADALVGAACDGTDGDLCAEGAWSCSTGTLSCSDSSTTLVERCNGLDDDCTSATADGTGETTIGTPCDGSDADLCAEGVFACAAGVLACTDGPGFALDLCNGVDDDCSGATTDGSGDPLLGTACDGADTDLCAEGTWTCSAGLFACSDSSGGTPDLCNGLNDDCNADTTDGSGEAALGAPCDGADADLCADGAFICAGGALGCADGAGSALDLCNGVDDDCNPITADGSTDPLAAAPCDGADSDLCREGVNSCTGGVLACTDLTAGVADLCNTLDDDCNPASSDGSGDPTVGAACDGADSDVCLEGVTTCTAGALTCSDATSGTIESCNGLDDNCDGIADDGAAAVLCPAPAGVAVTSCGGGAGCAISSCSPNRGNCDGVYANGCEIDTSSNNSHCGSCGSACAIGSCASGSCGLVITVEGHANVSVPCVLGDYSCQAHYVCNAVTGLLCVHQGYDCYTGSAGSWYPPDGASGDSNFNFAYAYDFGGGGTSGGYGNICACTRSQMTRYGLADVHTYCGVGRWVRR